MENDLEKTIQNAIGATIEKLKQEGMMNECRLSPREKTEHLLKNYNAFKASGQVGKAYNYVKLIDNGLKKMQGNPNADIIRLMYFEYKTREEVAEILNTTPTTVSRNKRKLLDFLAATLFPNECINDILY